MQRLLGWCTAILLTAGLCGCGTTRSATVDLCTGRAVQGACASTTHVLSNFSGQDILVSVSPRFAASEVQLLTFAKVGSAKWTLIDRKGVPVSPSGSKVWRPAAQWGTDTPWPAGRYRLVVQIAAANLGSTEIVVK